MFLVCDNMTRLELNVIVPQPQWFTFVTVISGRTAYLTGVASRATGWCPISWAAKLTRKTFQTPSLQKSTQKMMKLNLPPNVGFESGNFIQNLVDYLFQSFIGICFTTLLLFFLLCYLVSFCRTMDYFYRRWGTSESCTVRNDNAFCFSCVCISWCTTRLTSFLISLYLSH